MPINLVNISDVIGNEKGSSIEDPFVLLVELKHSVNLSRIFHNLVRVVNILDILFNITKKEFQKDSPFSAIYKLGFVKC